MIEVNLIDRYSSQAVPDPTQKLKSLYPDENLHEVLDANYNTIRKPIALRPSHEKEAPKFDFKSLNSVQLNKIDHAKGCVNLH